MFLYLPPCLILQVLILLYGFLSFCLCKYISSLVYVFIDFCPLFFVSFSLILPLLPEGDGIHSPPPSMFFPYKKTIFGRPPRYVVMVHEKKYLDLLQTLLVLLPFHKYVYTISNSNTERNEISLFSTKYKVLRPRYVWLYPHLLEEVMVLIQDGGLKYGAQLWIESCNSTFLRHFIPWVSSHVRNIFCATFQYRYHDPRGVKIQNQHLCLWSGEGQTPKEEEWVES